MEERKREEGDRRVQLIGPGTSCPRVLRPLSWETRPPQASLAFCCPSTSAIIGFLALLLLYPSYRWTSLTPSIAYETNIDLSTCTLGSSINGSMVSYNSGTRIRENCPARKRTDKIKSSSAWEREDTSRVSRSKAGTTCRDALWITIKKRADREEGNER